jgi:hypothetical protein
MKHSHEIFPAVIPPSRTAGQGQCPENPLARYFKNRDHMAKQSFQDADGNTIEVDDTITP